MSNDPLNQLEAVKAEGALKMVPTATKEEKVIGFKDKDSGDGTNGIQDILIEVALNGYCTTISFDDASVEKYVHENFDDVIKLIRSRH